MSLSVPPSLLDAATQKPFLKKLFAWYKKEGRHDMAWRLTEDAYAILVSEFMLQQTTVSTVKPYYERFLKRFPTLTSLAHADLNDVLALWSGLGYYARARNLWAAVRMVDQEFNGKVPRDQETLQQLPGIGFYTSGAISSLAYHQPAIVLDGNIIRVFMRLLAFDEDPKLKAVQVVLRKLSLDLSKLAIKTASKKGRKIIGGARDLVLALMDLGATICTPQNPQCDSCPVNQFCLAKAYGKQNSIPFRDEGTERPTIRFVVGLIQNKDEWLLAQRPSEGLFGGLWEFPTFELPQSEEPVPFLEHKLSEQLDATVRVDHAMSAFEHQLTHRIFIVRPFYCRFKNAIPKQFKKSDQYLRFKWIEASNSTQFGISAITKRILSLAEK